LFREEARERSPDNREINVAFCDRVDDARWRIVLAVITVEREAFDVVDDVASRQRVRGWSV
jgi:hypothetical protein